VAIAMHCNLRPPRVAPVALRFNFEARTKTEAELEPGHGSPDQRVSG